MKIVTYNVNGIRAAMKKGLVEWLVKINPDVVLLQEVKAEKDQVDVNQFEALGYDVHWKSAEKKGYSGVALMSKLPVSDVKTEIGIDKYDSEGRYIHANINGAIVASAYFPSGSSGDERQQFKFGFLRDFNEYQRALRSQYQNIVIGGDYNICHQDIDIHNPKANQKSSGFLPEEREWMTQFLSDGWVDSLRHLNKNPHLYTWWRQSFGGKVRAENKGWRIDYLCISEPALPLLKSATILSDAVHSDHCPVMVEMNL